MKVAWISPLSYLLGPALHIQREGHKSALVTKWSERPGDGLVETSTNVVEAMRAADLVVFESNGDFEDAQTARNSFGRPVVGATAFGGALERPEYREALCERLRVPLSEGETRYAIEGWFNSKDFVCASFLYPQTRLMAGDLGPVVGGAALTLKPDEAALVALEPFTETLREVGYRGPFTIFFDTDIVGLRAGFLPIHSLEALCELLKMDLTDFLHGVASGTLRTVPLREGWAMAARVSVPTYPYAEPCRGAMLTLSGYCEENARHVWPIHTYQVGSEVGVMRNGVACAVTARGEDPRECRRRILRTLKRVHIEDMMYRVDMGRSAEDLHEGVSEVWASSMASQSVL